MSKTTKWIISILLFIVELVFLVWITLKTEQIALLIILSAFVPHFIIYITKVDDDFMWIQSIISIITLMAILQVDATCNRLIIVNSSNDYEIKKFITTTVYEYDSLGIKKSITIDGNCVINNTDSTMQIRRLIYGAYDSSPFSFNSKDRIIEEIPPHAFVDVYKTPDFIFTAPKTLSVSASPSNIENGVGRTVLEFKDE